MSEIEKPLIGMPCNGCGICCQIRVCYNGAFIQGLVNDFGETVPGPCPALVKRPGGNYGCDIYLQPKKYIKNRPYPEDVLKRNFGHLIGAGTGCDDIGYSTDPADLELIDEIYNASKNEPDFIKKAKIALKVIYGIEPE